MITQQDTLGRPEAVRLEILRAVKCSRDDFYTVGELLLESRIEKHYIAWGYRSIEKWWKDHVDDKLTGYSAASKAEIIVRKSRALGISKDQLFDFGANKTKLQTIFRLEVDTHPDQIRFLLSGARVRTAHEIEEIVNQHLGRPRRALIFTQPGCTPRQHKNLRKRTDELASSRNVSGATILNDALNQYYDEHMPARRRR